jgi:hypothetical protein
MASSYSAPYSPVSTNTYSYPPSTVGRSPNVYTTARSTYAIGAAYETYASDYDNANVVVSSASYSPSPSPSVSPSPDSESEYDDLSSYLASIETVNGTAVATGSDSGTAADQIASSTSSSTGHTMSPIKIAAVGVPAVVGLIIAIMGIWLCCRCKKRRGERRAAGEQGGGVGYGEMRQVGQRGDDWRFSVTSLPQTTGGNGSRGDILTRNEVMGVVSPSRRPRGNRDADNGSYSPSPSYHRNQPGSYPYATSSRHSRWTDDSEFDAMAEDGSTITRTLSTTSTRQSIMTATDGPSSRENPFDHPAYTYRSAPPRAIGSSFLGTNSSMTPTSTATSSSHYPSTTFQSTLSPISPLTPSAATSSSLYQQQTGAREASQSDTYSIHSSDDGIFGAPASRPGLRREPTIIRHADSSAGRGSAGGGYATKVERQGRDGVVELPPLYEDATAGWSR